MIITNRTQLINYIISENGYKSYLEIGTANPDSNFNHIICDKKYSVDPGEHAEGYSEEMMKSFIYTHKMTSDEFFKQNTETFDAIFIDGLHTDYQCSLDIFNAFKCLNYGGSIIVHDTMPETENMTGDEHREILWQGNCWKPIYRLIHNINVQNFLDINTFYMDWGITVIRNIKEITKDNINEIYQVLIENPEDIKYNTHFHQDQLKPTYNASTFSNPKISYFTSLYNSDVKLLGKVYKALTKQTMDSWEWICFDDSITGHLFGFFNSLNDKRVKYYRLNINSQGCIGEAKYRAAMMCTGEYIAELDHDDIILPEMTEYLLKYGELYSADFLYTDSAEVYYNLDDDSIKECKIYPDGFGMGYGSYYQTRIRNPINDGYYDVQAVKTPPLNPKTLRHIVGIPNHIRCWKKDFYMKIGGHNRILPCADDYELVLLSVLNEGICVHIEWCGYLQIMHNNNTTDERRQLIQEYVKAIRTTYDKDIQKYFEKFDHIFGDWAKKYLINKFNNNILLYHHVPNFKDQFPDCIEPTYINLINVNI